MKVTRTLSRLVRNQRSPARCSKLALGKYEIQSKCKYRWARIPEGRARGKGNTGNNGKAESVERVVSLVPTFPT